MSASVDLQQLAVQRDSPSPGERRRKRIPWVRYLLPGLLLAGFAVLAASAARETLSAPHPVTVVPVLSGAGGTDAPVDTPLFQAAGWVEPRPAPTLVTALAEGVVEKVRVVEGQEVKAGEPIVELVAVDARLLVQTAGAEAEIREAEVARARAALTAARARHDRPLHLQTDLAGAEAALARARTEQALLPAQVRTAEVQLRTARRNYESLQNISDAVPALRIRRAGDEVEAAVAAVEGLRARQKSIPTEVSALERKCKALAESLERRTDEARHLAEAEASLRIAAGKQKQAQSALEAARLRLRRMTVRAPITGRVLTLLARPGSRLMGQELRGGPEASTVALLYEPGKLQARVDVRLEDVGKVSPGQRVQAASAALPGRTIRGRVLMLTSQADIQKNTVSVKVALDDPPDVLRPEMLAQVTFLAPPRPAGAALTAREIAHLLVPRQLVDGNRVWIADRVTGRARQRVVELGPAVGDLVVVMSGLAGSDKLIAGGREGLREGQRIRITGEDETMGVGQQGR
jgi:RND family efflux transporter MFP subunit